MIRDQFVLIYASQTIAVGCVTCCCRMEQHRCG